MKIQKLFDDKFVAVIGGSHHHASTHNSITIKNSKLINDIIANQITVIVVVEHGHSHSHHKKC